ncbi:hypothetical protein QO239_13200 [Cupriavidus taiwanensis]|uniref:Uncharacterized protein n=2 Tax=Cupriavidus TaxID=106589 RepID=A0A1K0IQA1_CUPNE|nr:hypothetical protein [Cupriavidus taiwanensis]MDK3023553.1 hypothetical protein [Cupriavidus taiwanensis]SCU96313.1 hypothetical protein CNECB9_5370001 [Cupriavidus necator]SOY51163.1 hypothetical protein CBM2587_A230146 [Cupriavidus taiwanensis]
MIRARTWRWLKLIGFLFGVLLIIPYGCDVAHRREARDCTRDVEAALYIGEICYLPTQYGTLFRLYDAQSGELLAERSYNDLEPKIVWGDNRVYYNTGASPPAYVRLPPTWLDRLRAKLP